MAEAISPSVLSDLAPAGKLRVGINYGNPVLATRDPASGDLRGVAVDLARELGKRVNLPVELVAFDSAGKMFDAAKDGAWDMAFLAIDPGRANQIDFTGPYVEIEGTYLVPAGSPVRAIEDVDRKGVRMGISSGSAYDLFLSRSIQHAELIRAPDPNGAFELILSGKVDVLAGVRQHLIANVEEASRIAGARRQVYGDSTSPRYCQRPHRWSQVSEGIHRRRKSLRASRAGDRESRC